MRRDIEEWKERMFGVLRDETNTVLEAVVSRCAINAQDGEELRLRLNRTENEIAKLKQRMEEIESDYDEQCKVLGERSTAAAKNASNANFWADKYIDAANKLGQAEREIARLKQELADARADAAQARKGGRGVADTFKGERDTLAEKLERVRRVLLAETSGFPACKARSWATDWQTRGNYEAANHLELVAALMDILDS